MIFLKETKKVKEENKNMYNLQAGEMLVGLTNIIFKTGKYHFRQIIIQKGAQDFFKRQFTNKENEFKSHFKNNDYGYSFFKLEYRYLQKNFSIKKKNIIILYNIIIIYIIYLIYIKINISLYF